MYSISSMKARAANSILRSCGCSTSGKPNNKAMNIYWGEAKTKKTRVFISALAVGFLRMGRKKEHMEYEHLGFIKKQKSKGWQCSVLRWNLPHYCRISPNCQPVRESITLASRVTRIFVYLLIYVFFSYKRKIMPRAKQRRRTALFFKILSCTFLVVGLKLTIVTTQLACNVN